MKITRDSIIKDILKDQKGSAAVFENHNMYCARCGGNISESVTLGAINHGIDPAKLISELQALGN